MFEFVEVKNADRVKRGYVFKCVLCLPKTNYISAFDNSTSNLKKHVDRKHKQHAAKYSELTTTSQMRKYRSESSSTPVKQLKIDEPNQGFQRVTQKTVDNSVLNFIAQGLQPFSVVELPAFKELVTDLQPQRTVMSRTTVRSKLRRGTTQMKERVKEEMRKASYIATTTDCWSARRRSFLGVTAHWLDPRTFKRHSAALACRHLKGSRTFDVLAGALNDIHLEYDIHDKIVRTTTDNGSNFIKAFHIFGDENNNAAAAAPEQTTYEDDKSDDLENEEEEMEFIEVEAILAEDDGLRYQLPKHQRCACHLLNLVSSVDAAEADKAGNYKKFSRFSQAEMCFLAEYAKTMAPVAKALNVLQGDVKVSMGHHLPTIAVLISKLENVRLSLKYCQLLVDALLGGVEKRFGEMMSDPELIAAAILQPMFKTTWTTDDVLQRGLGYIKEHLPSYDEPPLQPNDSSSTSDEDDFFSGLKHTHTQETTKQLDTYLACTSEGMDIFTPCPAVARLSLKLNTGLPASAACERLFSTAGLLFTPRRGRIHSQNLENQLLLKLNKAFFDFRKTATHR